MSRQIAVWQCPNCKRILQHEFSMYITYSLEGSLYCTCYGLYPAQPVCVELRTLFKMEPLNDAAKEHECMIASMREYWAEKARQDAESHVRAEAYRDTWGWAPAAQRFE